MRDLVRIRAQRAPVVRESSCLGPGAALGWAWLAPPYASQGQGPELDRILDLEATGPGRLPFRSV